LVAVLWVGATTALTGLFRFVDPPTTAFMLARKLQARQGGRQDFTIRQRWVALSELPEHVGLAVIAAEDQRFYDHGGFDLDAIKQALGAHLQGAPLRGASTLTQQDAKNLFLWESRSFARKALEGYFTALIELVWTKQRILEVYLNVAELGDGVFGVGAAARCHFAREARHLTPEQGALLAAILPDPRGRAGRLASPRVRRKQRWIISQLPAVRASQQSLLARHE
jgi:monofunctional biosynthetic peptidoglycan transglycosylase